jgi:cytochrome b561
MASGRSRPSVITININIDIDIQFVSPQLLLVFPMSDAIPQSEAQSKTAPKPRQNSVFKHLMSMHWWMALCYLLLFPSGIVMAKLEGQYSNRELLFAAHKSFGVLVLLLLIGRGYLLFRVWGKKYSKHFPRLTGNWYIKTALHSLLYVMMVVVPLTGYWLSNAYQANNISLFGIPMPDIFPVNSGVVSQAGMAHGVTSKLFAFLIVLHIVAQRKFVKASFRRFSDWTMKFKQAA